jgi:hypothetical protein
MTLSKNGFFRLLLLVVTTNYVVQIPYYIHQYYVPYGLLPSLYGTALLSVTLFWFLSAYKLLTKRSIYGYYLMLSFLGVEFLFYLQTQISQLLISHQILLHVYRPDGVLLFMVFGIGYINFVAAAYFIGYLLRNRSEFVGSTRKTT